jgi:trehalose utilization protein
MKTHLPGCMVVVGCLLLVTIWGGGWAEAVEAAESRGAKILIIAGPSQHPPGTHEVAAGARLMKHCLENSANMGPVRVELFDRWPDERSLDDTAVIVFIGDLFPPERMENPEKIKAELAKLMDGGCGMVCVHYATGLRAQHVGEDGDHPLLAWLGGYFASGCPHHQSTARVCTATIEPESNGHPILRGWREFTFDDEPYWNNYFGKKGPAENVTSLAFAMLPPEAPKKETVAWAVQRKDGGRGVGIVMPHFYRNWRGNDLRMLVLNSVCWSAKLNVPPNGVQSAVPDLAMFEPAEIDPQPRPKKK